MLNVALLGVGHVQKDEFSVMAEVYIDRVSLDSYRTYHFTAENQLGRVSHEVQLRQLAGIHTLLDACIVF